MKINIVSIKKIMIASLLLLALVGCELSADSNKVSIDESKGRVWTFIHFNVPEEGNKIDSFYYYGYVLKDLYEKINSNEITEGFILLKKVRYWGEGDLIYAYKDKDYSGDLTFRIEDIRRIKLLSSEPKVSPKKSKVSGVEEN